MIIKKFGNNAAIHFAKLGKEFADAADILFKNCQARQAHPSWPLFYTACLALELYLKAFLRANGVVVKDIIELSHDLKKILDKAKQKNLNNILNLSEDEEHVIRVLNAHYKNHDFRYKNSGEFTLAPINPIIELLKRIDRPIYERCVRAG